MRNDPGEHGSRRGSDGERVLTPPQSQDLPIGSRLRFAVGQPDALRSETWVVVGGKSQRDVYVGSRSSMGQFKLSLHKSGRWRLAQVDMSATDGEGAPDRVLMRFTPPEPVAQGWRFAARILIPTSCLGQPFPEQPPRGSEAISWWEAPSVGRTLSFNVFLGEEPYDRGFTCLCVGQVGRIALPGDCVVWVIADEIDSSGSEARLAQMRVESRRVVRPEESSFQRTMAWAIDDETGQPVIYDLGDGTKVRETGG